MRGPTVSPRDFASRILEVKLPKLYYVPFPIEQKYYPNMLKWTHSNAVTLEKIGHDAAVAFAEALRSSNQEEFEQKYRYYNHVERRIGSTISRAPSPICSVPGSRAEQPRGGGAMDEWLTEPSKIGLLASGGAPNLHLIAGALCAFYERRRASK